MNRRAQWRVLVPAAALGITLLVAGAVLSRRVAADRAVPPDTIALAAAAQRACGALEGSAQRECYERFLVDLVPTRGVRMAMGTLNLLRLADSLIEQEGHVYAHAIGITAGRGSTDPTAQFAGCTEILQSGCYHGVIQGYFETVSAVDTQSVNALCAPYAGAGADRWLRFQCVHGLGHGLTMIYEHDLPRGLGGCDLLRDDWDRESCYGGAFMENIVHATAPHHPANRLAAARPDDPAGGGHDHVAAAVPARPAFRPLDSLDLHYPCSMLSSRYLTQCYMMQTSIILTFNGGDFGRAAVACLGAPRRLRYVCAQSLGRDATSYARQHHGEAVRMCSTMTAEYQPWCHVGVAKNLIDLTARPADGMAYCRVVPGVRNKLKCYEAVGEQIATLRNGPEERRPDCDAAEEAYREACYFGAQVSTRRPPGLPQVRS